MSAWKRGWFGRAGLAIALLADAALDMMRDRASVGAGMTTALLVAGLVIFVVFWKEE